MKLKKLLNEIQTDYGTDNWKQDFQQMKVYDNPFHKAFSPKNENQPTKKPTGNKMLTEKVIKKLREKKVRSKSPDKRKKLQTLIDRLEENYEKGNFLNEVKSLYGVIKEAFFQRKDMPQVKTDDLNKAISTLKRMGIRVKRGTATPDDFEPSQKDIYQSKVDAILKRTTQANIRGMKPLIISKDNFIVDGHHRWKALLIGFPSERIPYIKIGLPIKRAVQVYNKVAEKV